MAVLEQLVEALGKLPDGTPDDLKKSIKELFQSVSVEAGKAKTDLETYKKGDSEYKKLTKKLKDAGISEDQFESIADELGVKKTLQDELVITKEANKDLAKRLKDAEQGNLKMRMENTIGRKVEELAKAYKTPDGKTVKVSEKFIDKNELYKSVDLENDVLVQDRINKVLNAAYETQAAFLKDVGIDLPGVTTHKVPVGEGGFGSGKALDEAAIRQLVTTSKGNKEAAAAALTAYEQSKK